MRPQPRWAVRRQVLAYHRESTPVAGLLPLHQLANASSSKGMPALPAVSGSKMAFVEERAKGAVNFAPTILAMGERAKTKKMLDKAQRPQRSPAPDEDLGRLD